MSKGWGSANLRNCISSGPLQSIVVSYILVVLGRNARIDDKHHSSVVVCPYLGLSLEVVDRTAMMIVYSSESHLQHLFDPISGGNDGNG